MSIAWVNGRFVDEHNGSISLRDTGLLHAAGVFTTMRASNGRVFRLDRHLARLRHSCQAFFIPLQYEDGQLTEAVGGLLTQNELSDARLRITVTRGSARQDPVHGLHLEPACFITATDLEPYPAEFYRRGLTVIVLDEQKLNPYDIQAGHKTLNYLSRLAALRAANQRGAGEALWFNVHNYLQSGSISNVFVAKDGALVTPPTDEELRDPAVRNATAYPKSVVLPGITRQAVIELARASNIPVSLASISINELLEADEVLLTNSIMQVMPVGRIERRAIGQDKPGPLTLKLSEAFAREVESAR